MGEQASAELISLPQGGGALRAVGETFQPDLHTGTGNYRIPLELPPGRGALTPQLALAYGSGSGNGPFGLGWTLSVPGVRRKTDKRLPRYDGSDVFVLSGAEDLVPVPGAAGAGVQRYRPRTETLFARVEHHTGASDHWTVWSKDGLRSTYGTPRPATADATWRDMAVIADPGNPRRIFGWLLSSTVDTFGNTIAYSYAPDPADPAGAQRYLTQIGYADHGDRASPAFLVQVRFTYQPRPDRHTDRRGGFPVTTGQRCASIETWMNPGTEQLARRVTLTYTDAGTRAADNGVSLLTRVTVTGHDGDATQSLPPVEFGYSTWDPARRRYQPVGDLAAGAAPDRSLASRDLDLADLFGDGLPDVLQLSGGVGRYWRNRGAGRLDLPRSLPAAPAGVALGGAGVQLLDADGDGRPDLLVTDGRRAGYFPISRTGGFDPAGYQPYRAAPAFGLTDPDTRLIDLDGDGVADALRTGTSLQVYLNDRAAGWTAQPAGGASPLDAVSFTDPRVKLADMTGDGLTDVVLVASGRLQYWPNLGYGRFGPPVIMADSPRFDDATLYGPTGFDPARLLLGDVDGDGAADVVYAGPRGTTVWVNQSGHGFAPPVVMPATPQPDNATALRLADLLGAGTAGVLWSYNAGAVRGGNYKFLDLTGGIKPYLLTRIDNHAGAVTAIAYAPSTRYAEADAAAGTPWRTTLPFPVHVVAATQVTDYFSGTTLSSEYHYHHGYWDGADREFRGFARVDHRDTLTPATAMADDPALSPPAETRTWFHPGPVGPEHGAWAELDLTGEYWPGDPPLAAHLDLSALPTTLPRRALRDAVRAARGTLLRQELYALDGTPLAARPYEISEHAIAVAPVLDGRTGDDPAWQAAPVITTRPTLARTTVWERGTDPMHRIQATGNYDTYGRPATHVDIAVPRGHDPRRPDPAGAEPYLAVLTITTYATRDDPAGYMTDRVASTRRGELAATTATTALDLAAAALAGTAPGALRSLSFTFYDGPPGAGPAAPPGQPGGLPFGQVGDHGLPVRTEQLAITPERLTAASQPGDGDGLSAGPPAYLPLHGPPTTAPPPDQYPDAFTQALPPLAGYTWHPEGTDPATGAVYTAGYYVQAARHAYDIHTDPAGRGLPVAHRDPLGHDTTIGYDPYQLLPATVTDPLGLTHTAGYDYRTLRPALITDPNGNRTQAGYTPLGLPAWTAATGKDGASQGDTPDQPGTLYDYHLTAFDDSATAPARQPISVATTHRVQHRWDIVDAANAARASAGQPPLTGADIAALFPPGETATHPSRFVRTVEYSDGFGRLLQARTQADTLILDDLGLTADQTAPAGPARAHRAGPADPVPVTVSGWKRYDNKGRVITAWEPFYGAGDPYQAPGTGLLNTLAKVETRYDPRGLPVLVTGPDGSQTLTIPGIPHDLTDPASYTPTPWISYHYDPDDNAGRTHPATSTSYSGQYNTPDSTTVDPLGRPVTHIQRLAPSDTGAAVTTTSYDIDGNITSITDPLGRTATSTVYDMLNRAWRHASLDAGVTRTVLDPAGGAIETRDGKGAITLTGYDPGHRPTRLWAADRPGQAPTLRQVTVYGDQPEAGLTAAGAAGAAGANLMGRPYRSYDEAGLLTTSGYDLDGNLLTKTRQTLRADLLLSGLPAGPGSWDGTAYAVDWQPSPGQTLGQHAATLLEPAGYQTDMAYDALHRVTTLTGPVDVTGARTTLTHTYTPAGQLTSVTADGTPQLAQAIYNARGQRSLAVLGSGTLIRYVHDPATFRLTRLRAEPASAPAGQVTWTGTGNPQNVLQDYGYDYDLAGNLLTLRDRTPGSGLPLAASPARSPSPDALDRAFSYDPLYRLHDATGRETALPPSPPWLDTPAGTDITKAQPYTETYDYDLAGNLLTLRHASNTGYTRTCTPAPGSNRLATLTINGGRLAYTHDPAGNLTSEGDIRRFEWDHANRLATFRTQTGGAAPSIYAQYRYDGAGNRIIKIVRRGGSAPDIAVYIDGLFERLIVSNGTQAATTHDAIHILDDHARIGILCRGAPVPGDPYPDATYHLGDHLTSSTGVLDTTGQLLNREEYTPYGETSFGSYSRKRYRYTGKERDEESGLAYHGARYYAPWLARWASPDPLGLADGTNLYVYVRSNPLILIDPFGTDASVPIAHRPPSSRPEQIARTRPQSNESPSLSESDIKTSLGLTDEQLGQLKAVGATPEYFERKVAEARSSQGPRRDPIGDVAKHVDLRGAELATTVVLKAVQIGFESIILGGALSATGTTGEVIGVGLKLYSAQRNARVAISGQDDGKKVGTGARLLAGAAVLLDVFLLGKGVKSLSNQPGGGGGHPYRDNYFGPPQPSGPSDPPRAPAELAKQLARELDKAVKQKDFSLPSRYVEPRDTSKILGPSKLTGTESLLDRGQ
jgi:RHS repeat-associated protein